MRPFPSLLLMLLAGAAVGQPLTCPPASNISGRPCEVFHFHIAMYRPDTRGFVEVFGINQFASQAACDRAREAAMTRNLAIVDHMKRVANDQQYQPDRFGICHCDMTVEKSSPNFLTDLQRVAQLRLAEDIRMRVRERLLSTNLPSDSDLIRGLAVSSSANSLLESPRLVPLPPQQTVGSATNTPDDLRLTKAVESTSAPIAALDLPLIDIPVTEIAAPPPTQQVVTIGPNPAAAPAPAPAPAPLLPSEPVPNASASAPTPAPSPAAAAPPARAPAPSPAPMGSADAAPKSDDVPTAEEAADAFISYETQRIQNVLTASAAITDEALKSKILESCMQRIQLLSNLRTLIQGSGARSRLATAARTAHGEPERLALVARLFGSDMPPHWAPKDASDVILPPMADMADAEKMLRDSSGKFSEDQKRHALYVVLARTQPTEDQQLWLSTVVDTFLQ